MELHGAGLQGAIGRHHQEAQAGLAAGGPAVGEVAARGFEGGGRVDDPVGLVAARLHAVQLRVQLRKLFGRVEEVIAAAGAPRRVGAVAQVDAPLAGLVRNGADLAHVLAGDATVEHDVVVPQLRQARNQVLEMPVEARIGAEIVVPLVGEIQADGELVDAGLAQRQVLLLGHERPVGNQDGVRQLRPALDVADNLDHVVAQQRLAARDLHHAGAQRLHVAAVFGGLQIARFIARPAVVAVLAEAGAGVRHLERNHDGAFGDPVERPSPDNPQRFDEGDLAQTISLEEKRW